MVKLVLSVVYGFALAYAMCNILQIDPAIAMALANDCLSNRGINMAVPMITLSHNLSFEFAIG